LPQRDFSGVEKRDFSEFYAAPVDNVGRITHERARGHGDRNLVKIDLVSVKIDLVSVKRDLVIVKRARRHGHLNLGSARQGHYYLHGKLLFT
jgi:hypothetical protein